MSMNDINQERICVQQILPKHLQELNSYDHPSISKEHRKRLQAAFFTKKLWKQGSKITIGFLDKGNQIPRTTMQALEAGGDTEEQIDPLQKTTEKLPVQQAVKKIVKERIQPLVNLRLEFVDDPTQANIRISFDPDGGAWSLVGTDALHQKKGATMNLGWFDVPTVMHEFGHMLGMIHEHQNPRGDKIKWDESAVFKWAKSTQGWSEKMTEQNIIDRYDISSINGSNFDPQSIMLYFFPGSLTTNNKGTHQNLELSGLDVEWISKMYPTKQGETATQFYKRVYDTSLQDNIEKSKQLATEMEVVGSTSHGNTILIIACVILAILALFGLFMWWRKSSRGRYGR
jgi:hypothetical protein